MNALLRTEQDTSALELVSCPECHAPCEVEWRSGELAKIRCLARHWFLMPEEGLGRL
ncbi:MAG: hypothetical protein M3319_03655 [Actinomycetota bacterium]|nr:hypothetical protein [Actinomycetota bacterium]